MTSRRARARIAIAGPAQLTKGALHLRQPGKILERPLSVNVARRDSSRKLAGPIFLETKVEGTFTAMRADLSAEQMGSSFAISAVFAKCAASSDDGMTGRNGAGRGGVVDSEACRWRSRFRHDPLVPIPRIPSESVATMTVDVWAPNRRVAESGRRVLGVVHDR